jgi:hypothetical protein
MANESTEAIQLQLAVAFGQGTGAMMADPDAILFALSEQRTTIERAARDWTSTKHTLFQLVRLIGQIAAVHAAMDKKPQIEKAHVVIAIPIALEVCPCLLPLRA